MTDHTTSALREKVIDLINNTVDVCRLPTSDALADRILALVAEERAWIACADRLPNKEGTYFIYVDGKVVPGYFRDKDLFG